MDGPVVTPNMVIDTLDLDAFEDCRPSMRCRDCSVCDVVELQQMQVEAREYSAQLENMLEGELLWLRRMMDSTPEYVRSKLVAHRGFHQVEDAACRPLENSISSFTQAWAHGLTYCESDITLLSDGHMVLHTEKCLTRFAADDRQTSDGKHEDLTTMHLGDVLRTQLTNGQTAPLLDTVLKHAKALSGKLVIELKPKCTSPATLVELLANDPGVVDCVSVITSHDRNLPHEFIAQYKNHPSAPSRRPSVLLLTRAEACDEHDVALPGDQFAHARSICGDDVDGVYVEWRSSILSDHMEAFTQLCREMIVGVWQQSGINSFHIDDNCAIATKLVDCGAAYVNTDLPYTFATNCIAEGCGCRS